jgi:hypothetical protein
MSGIEKRLRAEGITEPIETEDDISHLLALRGTKSMAVF